MEPETANINRTLFVKTPWRSTKSFRNLSVSSTISDLKGDLELTTGYPCNTHTLYYGANCLDKEETVLYEELPPGAVIKMVLKSELEGVLECLMKVGEANDVYRCCVTDDGIDCNKENDIDVENRNYNIGKLFFVTFLSTFEGKLTLVKELLHKMPQLLSSKTLMGRTLAHVAAASDHPQILLEVLAASVKQGLQTSAIDRYRKTPMDCAKENHAFLCERLIRNFNQHQRAGTLGSFLAQKESDENKYTENTVIQPKKPRAKSAVIPPRSHSAFSTMSSVHSNMKLKKQVSFETMSSGYQTDENRLSRGTIPSQNASPSPDSMSTESKCKKVKFKSRIKSAPPKMISEEEAALQRNETKFRASHNTCFKGKPFMAYREVDPDELRSVSVEYIPMERRHFIGMDAKNREKKVQNMLSYKDSGSDPTTPYSSLNNSLQDLTGFEESDADEQMGVKYAWHQNKGTVLQSDDPRTLAQEDKKKLFQKFTYPKSATTKRVQSAKYYKANYHIRAEEDKYYEDIPRPRPKGAGPKYRAWKPWLLEMYKQQAKQRKEDAKNWERKQQNMVAFKEWLKNKHQEEEDKESSSEDDDDYTEGETFDSWLKKKKPVLEKMDRKRKEEKQLLDNPQRKPLVDRHVTIYELCSTDGIPMKIDSPYTYMKAYQKWKRRKEKYDYWKKKNNPDANEDDAKDLSLKEVKAMRSELYLNGFTYTEWLGQIQREDKAKERESKKKVKFSEYVL